MFPSTVEGVLVFDSGIYNFGIAFGQVDLLRKHVACKGFPLIILTAGDYVMILSTFVSGQYGRVLLEVSCVDRVAISRAPVEGAGMHLTTMRGQWCVSSSGLP